MVAAETNARLEELAVGLAEIRRDTQYLKSKVDQTCTVLTGNGQGGVVVRLDRLEQSQATTRRVMWALFVGFLAPLAAYAVRLATL